VEEAMSPLEETQELQSIIDFMRKNGVLELEIPGKCKVKLQLYAVYPTPSAARADAVARQPAVVHAGNAGNAGNADTEDEVTARAAAARAELEALMLWSAT
jgi:hypothetical protein